MVWLSSVLLLSITLKHIHTHTPLIFVSFRCCFLLWFHWLPFKIVFYSPFYEGASLLVSFLGVIEGFTFMSVSCIVLKDL